MNSIHLWYPPFHSGCAQARRSSAQAIHSHPQVCAQSTAGNSPAKPVTRVAQARAESLARPWGSPRRCRGEGLACRVGGRWLSARGASGWLRHNRRAAAAGAAATGDSGEATSFRALRPSPWLSGFGEFRRSGRADPYALGLTA